MGEERYLSGADFALFWDKDISGWRGDGGPAASGSPTRAGAVAPATTRRRPSWPFAARVFPMPETLVAPMTYDHMAGPEAAFLEEAAARLGFPLVVRECFGSLGGQVYLAETGEDFVRLARTMGPRPFLAQRYIAESAGRDVRIYVVGGRPEAAMERRSTSDFRANIGSGGHALAYQPSRGGELAVRCCRILGLDFAGVDLLFRQRRPPLSVRSIPMPLWQRYRPAAG